MKVINVFSLLTESEPTDKSPNILPHDANTEQLVRKSSVSQSAQKQSELQLSLYKSSEEVLNQSQAIHSHIGWKSLTSTQTDILACSDRDQVDAQLLINETMEKQSLWIKAQHKTISNQNDRFEHFMNVIQNELKREHDRESRLLLKAATTTTANKQLYDDFTETTTNASSYLTTNIKNTANIFPSQKVKVVFESAPPIRVSGEYKLEAMRVWQERLDAADRMMATLASYGFICGLEQSDYLKYCLLNWKKKAQHIYKTVQNNTSFSVDEIQMVENNIIHNNHMLTNSNDIDSVYPSVGAVADNLNRQPSYSKATGNYHNNKEQTDASTSNVTNDGIQPFMYHQPVTATAQTHTINHLESQKNHVSVSGPVPGLKYKSNMDNLGLISVGQSSASTSTLQYTSEDPPHVQTNESSLPAQAQRLASSEAMTQGAHSKGGTSTWDKHSSLCPDTSVSMSQITAGTSTAPVGVIAETAADDVNTVTSLSFVGSEFVSSEYHNTHVKPPSTITAVRPVSSSQRRTGVGSSRPTSSSSSAAALTTSKALVATSMSSMSQQQTRSSKAPPQFMHRPRLSRLNITSVTMNRAQAKAKTINKKLKGNVMLQGTTSPYEMENLRIMESALPAPMSMMQIKKSSHMHQSQDRNKIDVCQRGNTMNVMSNNNENQSLTASIDSYYNDDAYANMPVVLQIGYHPTDHGTAAEYNDSHNMHKTHVNEEYDYDAASVDVETLTLATQEQDDDLSITSQSVHNATVMVAAKTTGNHTDAKSKDTKSGKKVKIISSNTVKEKEMTKFPLLDEATLLKCYNESRQIPKQQKLKTKTTSAPVSVSLNNHTNQYHPNTITQAQGGASAMNVEAMRKSLYMTLSPKEIIMNAISLSSVLDVNQQKQQSDWNNNDNNDPYHEEKTAPFLPDINKDMDMASSRSTSISSINNSHSSSHHMIHNDPSMQQQLQSYSSRPMEEQLIFYNDDLNSSCNTLSVADSHTVATKGSRSIATVITKTNPQHHDNETIRQRTSHFHEAEMAHHIRTGTEYDTDLLLPALIPFPSALYVGDPRHHTQRQPAGTTATDVTTTATATAVNETKTIALEESKVTSNNNNPQSAVYRKSQHQFADKTADPMSYSYTSDAVMDSFRLKLTQPNTGHAKKTMLPLYVRQSDHIYPSLATTTGTAMTADNDSQNNSMNSKKSYLTSSAAVSVTSSASAVKKTNTNHNLGYNHMMGRNIIDFECDGNMSSTN